MKYLRIPLVIIVILTLLLSFTGSVFASDPIAPVKVTPITIGVEDTGIISSDNQTIVKPIVIKVPEVTDVSGAVPFNKQLNVREVGDTVRLDTNTVSTLNSVTALNGKSIQTWTAKVSGLPQTMNDLVTPLNTDWVNQQDGSIKTGNNLFEAVVTGSTVKVTYKGNSQTWTPKVMVGVNEDKPSIPIITKDLINPNYNVNTIAWYYTSCTRYLRVIEGSIQESYVFYRNPNDNVQIFDNIYKDAGFTYREIPIAFDADNKSIRLSGDKGISKTEFNRTDIAYPITIDPTSSFTTSASDGFTYGSNVVYNTAQSDTVGSYLNATSNYLSIGQSYSVSNPYYIQRTGLYFDTSSIGSSVTVTGATLGLYGMQDSSTTDFDITVQTGGGTYPHDPMVTGDYNKTNYSGNGGTFNTSGFSTVGYNVINLNATGYGWINQTGVTKFALRSSLDIAGTAPTGNGIVYPYSYEQGTGRQPYLSVTYTALAPSITANVASSVGITSARLNSLVTSDGGDIGACTVQFGYGTVSHIGDFASYTTKTSVTIPTSTYSTNDYPYLDVTGLTSGTTYYYSAQITNSTSTVVSANEISFATGIVLSSPTNINAYPSSTSMQLDWAKGVGANNTYIYRRTSPFSVTIPTLTDGTGTATGSPITLVMGTNTITVTGAGTFYALGVSGTATSGTATLAGSPVTLDSANDLLDTGATTGNFVINVTSINGNPNLLTNGSFEIGDPPTGWNNINSGVLTQSAVQAKIGTYSALLTGNPTGNNYQPVSAASTAGKTITMGCWAWTATATNTQIAITDNNAGGVFTLSSACPADSSWHWLTVTMTMAAGANTNRANLGVASGAAYFDGAILVEGTGIPLSGTLVYSSTGTSFIDTGLTLGTTYYYSFISESGGSYSASYASIVMTTSALGVSASTFAQVNQPNNYDITNPDSSKLSKLGPFYDLTNGFVDSWGMARGNAWAGIFAVLITIAGLIIYIKSKSITGALIVVLVCLVITTFLGITSGWWILFGACAMFGSMALPKREV